jgi:hypothetical protein
MLLCATASETNVQRENKQFNPTLDRAAAGPEGFPAGKDQQEGYGMINPDAAVEAVSQTYAMGSTATGDLGGSAAAKRVWARTANLKAGCDITVSLTNPAGADFDLYLYSAAPNKTGTPVLLASSTVAKAGDPESLQYTPTADGPSAIRFCRSRPRDGWNSPMVRRSPASRQSCPAPATRSSIDPRQTGSGRTASPSVPTMAGPPSSEDSRIRPRLRSRS